MTWNPFAQWPKPPGADRRCRTCVAVGLSLALLLLAVARPALAESPPPSGLEEIGQKVSDSELAEMRGKFVLSSSSVAYFGVQMMTSWQGQDGITTTANLMFTLNFSGGQPSPQIMIGWTRQGDPAMDVASAPGGAPGAAPDNSAFATTAGAVQSTVIAGSDNRALNTMTIAIAPLSGVNQAIPPGLGPASSSQTQTFANGDTLHFVIGPSGLGLTLGNGPSAATQMIDAGAGQATQTITLLNNNNSVFNNMSMIVGLAPGQNPAQIQAQQAVLSHIALGL